MARRVRGEGTIYLRKDGRYEAAAYFLTTAGTRKRVRFYGKTRQEVHMRLTEATVRARQGVPTPDKNWRLGDYLDYWLREVVRPSRRPKTYEAYELRVRLNLKPHLGGIPLQRLTVPTVQTFLNERLSAGDSVRKVQIMRTVLGAALSRAQREELVTRNVARLVELPAWERGEIQPWNVQEAKDFLAASRTHPLYWAFLLLLLYGLRRGEVLGIRWCDVNVADGVLHIRQQLQRVGGDLLQCPVKTKAGRRDLPLLDAVSSGLTTLNNPGSEELVFTTANKRPIEPNNFVRSFKRLCKQHGLRVIKLHHLRHTAATFLKDLGVPARDAQLILGHSQISVTQEIYQHGAIDSHRDALQRVERALLLNPKKDVLSRQFQPSRRLSNLLVDWITSGGPSGDRTQDTLLKRQVL